MRSVAKNTLKKGLVKAPQEPPDAPLLQRLERVQRERRCRQSWQGVQPDSVASEPA